MTSDEPRDLAAGCDAAWEEAYSRFQSPEQEVRKFVRRLRKLGATRWPHDDAVLELFCGRGNGLQALERLGFANLTGVDLSPSLASRYRGPARILVHDCRRLPFGDASYGVAIVQGGLHHLPALPEDLALTLGEVRRVLRVGGRFVVVEPWRTPFLEILHAISRRRAARALSPKLDAYQTMVDCEGETFARWLAAPQQILALLRGHFATEHCSTAWGKLHFIGRKASE